MHGSLGRIFFPPYSIQFAPYVYFAGIARRTDLVYFPAPINKRSPTAINLVRNGWLSPAKSR